MEVGNAKTAWIVDDEAVNRLLAAAFLQRLGWRTRDFACGDEVLDASASGLPPLLIIDIRMPRLSGTELMQRLRQHPDAHQAHFMAYTAHCLKDEAKALLDKGFHRVLSKPVSFQQMKEAVEDVTAPRA